MIFTQENEYAAVLDACVLVPASLCDMLLRLAEEPAMYRPLWSEEILEEMAKALKTKLHKTNAQTTYRRQQMNIAFPEATVTVPAALTRALAGLPDDNDRHVLGAAVMAHANAIITQNIKHFPQEYLEEYGVLCQTADDFLIHQYHFGASSFVSGATLMIRPLEFPGTETRVISSLKSAAPGFAKLMEDEHSL